MSDLTEKTAVQLADAVRTGETTAEAVALADFERIAALEPSVRAFLAVTQDAALAQARAVDEKRKAGKALGALAGVPVALKDNLQLTGVETTCASKIFRRATSRPTTRRPSRA